MIQIRHVPDAVHGQLKVHAATRGLTLSDYLRRGIEAIAAYPTQEEIAARLAALEPVRTDTSAVDELRATREERDADAAYVALAESLDATLFTRDERLASAPGVRARLEIV